MDKVGSSLLSPQPLLEGSALLAALSVHSKKKLLGVLKRKKGWSEGLAECGLGTGAEGEELGGHLWLSNVAPALESPPYTPPRLAGDAFYYMEP